MTGKFFVLGLDGFSYSYLEQNRFRENMPFFTRLCMKLQAHSMSSVIPVISSVAWTSYSTGKNPGEHGIYGFVDKINNPFRLIVPTSNNRKKDTIFKVLSKNKKVYSINVPISYPPEPVSGKMVSCFLCPELQKATYTAEYWKELYKRNYIIDVDASLIGSNPIEMLQQLIKAMEIRFELIYDIVENEEWDFVQLHIMETDRLLHFFYTYITDNITNTKKEKSMVNEFFLSLDTKIEKLVDLLGDDCRLLVLSDHGMCEIKSEVQINLWLKQRGWLKISDNVGIAEYDRESICYSLTPGRIYINIKGREEKGTVNTNEYEYIREMIREELLQMKYIDTDEPIMDKVYRKEELYFGDEVGAAPDLVAHPRAGFDLKANTTGDSIFTHTYLNGMHTFEDAMIVGKNVDVSQVNSIDQVYDVIMRSID